MVPAQNRNFSRGPRLFGLLNGTSDSEGHFGAKKVESQVLLFCNKRKEESAFVHFRQKLRENFVFWQRNYAKMIFGKIYAFIIINQGLLQNWNMYLGADRSTDG